MTPEQEDTEAFALIASQTAPIPDERAAFEAWLDENRMDKGRFADGIYHSAFTRCAWQGWQARAAR